MPGTHCTGCEQKKTARNRPRDGSEGWWCDGCRKRYARWGTTREAVCLHPDCRTVVNVTRSGVDMCINHRPCAVCDRPGAPSVSPDQLWPGHWCGACYIRFTRHGDPHTGKRPATDAERFASWVGPPDANGCTLWEGHTNRKGYGQIRWGGTMAGAHRVAMLLDGRPPVPPRTHSMHSCDTPACVNPAHLSWGTNAENVADKMAKGRQASGPDLSVAIKQGLANQ